MGLFLKLLVGLLFASADASCNVPSCSVRREIRSISDVERKRVFAALHIMKTVDQEAGESKYGKHFLNYDRLVLKHIRAATHPTCDQGHMGPAFLTFHRALMLSAENSLRVIDPQISGLPYWDYNVDWRAGNPRSSKVWSADYFGEASGDPENNYMIRDGFAKNWTINSNAKALFEAFPVDSAAIDLSPDVVQPFNFLRGPTNLQTAPRVTRSNMTCGALTESTDDLVTWKNWSICRAEPPADAGLMPFFDCIDHAMAGVHSFYHPWLGGAWGASDGNCAAKQRPPSLADVVTGVMVCPPCIVGEDCRCHRNESAFQALNASDTCNKMPMNPNGPCNTCGSDCADGELGACGDPWDAASSANDPSFLFHHVNVDRLFMEWQLRWNSSAFSYLPYSGFPKTGMCSGHNLHDVASDRDPFYGFVLKGSYSGRLTNEEILAATVPNSNPLYTYDSLRGERQMDLPPLDQDYLQVDVVSV